MAHADSHGSEVPTRLVVAIGCDVRLARTAPAAATPSGRRQPSLKA